MNDPGPDDQGPNGQGRGPFVLAHATCVALEGRGVLIRGPSGSGKSDLALRLINEGALLVADDQTELAERDGRLVARAPATIAGRLEVRGVGIVAATTLAEAPVALIVDLVQPGDAEIERLPEPEQETLLGIALPHLSFHAFNVSTVAKLKLALEQVAPRRAAAAEVRRVVLITGLSGAGRSTALEVLEDIGYEAINNLPLELLQATVGGTAKRPLAVGVDIRTRDFAAGRLFELLDQLLTLPGLEVRLVFIDCDDETLVRRFTETRRRHPLAQDRPVIDGIQAERRMLQPVKARADLPIDTSLLSPHDLKRLLAGHLSLADDGGLGMMTFVTSFSYKCGLPREADLVLDVRFLRNPHYDAVLRSMTGLEETVAAYVAADPDFEHFFTKFTAWLEPLLPRYEAEGKSYLTIAVGCTGGRHRSVFVAERLGRWLGELGRPAVVAHRDLTA